MKKNIFNKNTDNIEVPEQELFSVIDKAVEKGRLENQTKKKSLITVSVVSMIASFLFISGLVFSPMTKVLAEVPVIGYIYESLHMNMGRSLLEKNLITDLNHSASDQGIDITVTSMYVDGSYIGITFKVEGEEIDTIDTTLGYNQYQHMDQGVKIGWSGSLGDLVWVDHHLESAIELQYPDEKIPGDFNFPVIFENIGGVEGNWKFELPASQLPVKAYEIRNSTTEEGGYSFTLNTMMIGESNMRVSYSTNIPVDNLHFTIYDDKGNELSKNTHLQHNDISAVFSTEIKDDINYLFIHPIYRLNNEFIKLEPIQVTIGE